MHTTEVGTNNVPAFLIKLWKLVEDEDTNDLIRWSPDGRSFYLYNQTQFSKELLPLYFKHNNMASFIRQLNMYGFRKVASIDQGALKPDRDALEFFHNFFVRGQECMLEFIKRKVPSTRSNAEDSRARSDVLKELLSDVGSMQGRQEHVDHMLADMKKENEALWREVALLRQKHIKQQQIVEKLIQFLVSMVQGNRNITVKRKLPLMLQDNPSSSSKNPRLKKSQFGSSTEYQVSSPASLTTDGPMIHEVTDIIEDVADSSTLVTGSPTIRMDSTIMNNKSTNTTPPPASPAPLSLSSAAGSVELDSPPIVAMPMDPTEPIEPLSLMEALSDSPTGIYILPDSSAEVEISSTGDISCESSISIAPAAVPQTNKAGPAPHLKSVDEAATSSDDLLRSCIMLENVPLMTTQTASDAKIPQELDRTSKQTKDVASAASHTAVVQEVRPLPQNTGMQVALQDRNTATSSSSLCLDSLPEQLCSREPKVFSEHLEGIDTELDWLQDQLMSGGLNLDSATLLGVCPDWRGISNDLKLFGSDDPLANCLGDLVCEGRDTEAAGNEVVQYTSSLLDLQAIDDDSGIFDPALTTGKADSVSSRESVGPLQAPVSEPVNLPQSLSAGSKKGPSKKRRSRK